MVQKTESKNQSGLSAFTRMAGIGLVLLSAFAASSCRLADPTPDDLDRVKEEFLILRFHAPFSREYSQMKDLELFEKSCVSKRVRCERVLEMLKEKDPSFYRRLVGGQDV